ncbi:MAG TPA: monovalent cation/H(+) antiporter subunit G [Rhodopila sp.]|nr:monovalent cation/H(+) antiporter subunit G [Rhodopila sp.]
MIAACLSALVVAVWIGCLGFVRLSSPYDRLHCATFIAAAGGVLAVLAAFLADGTSDRAWKIVLVVLLVLVNGSALSHAVSRAMAWREDGSNRT